MTHEVREKLLQRIVELTDSDTLEWEVRQGTGATETAYTAEDDDDRLYDFLYSATAGSHLRIDYSGMTLLLASVHDFNPLLNAVRSQQARLQEIRAQELLDELSD